MRKFYFLLLTILFAAITTNAQVTGTKTIGVDYPTIAAAVADLNATGVGAGGATINVPAGYTETVPSGGLVLGSTLLNASLSGANPLIFQKSGPGVNPVLTAFTGGSSINSDGVFKLQGTDYVTIDGIDVAENGANTAAALMEWGYALVNLNASAPFDGCQNNTLKNCTITLNRSNPNGAFGVYSAHNIATNATALVLTAVGDLHSNNKFYSNTIQNVNEGFWILGYAAGAPYTLFDQNNDVGGSSPATGNTLRTMGVTSLFNTFCIYLVNQNNANASYNMIDNAAGGGVTSSTQLIGIYTGGTNSTFTATHNNILLTVNLGSAITAGIYTANTGDLTVSDNIIGFSDAAGSGTHYGIYSSSITTASIMNNSLTANTTGAVTGALYFIYNNGAATNATISNNTISNVTTSTTGVTGGIYNAVALANYTVSNNTITNINRTSASGTFYGMYTGSPTNGLFNANTVDGVTFSTVGSSGTIYGIYDISSGVNMTYTNNVIKNFSTPTAGTLYGIREFGVAGNKIIQNNQVSNFSTSAGGAGGLSATGISWLTGGNDDISNNTVFAINSTGTTGGTGGTIIGILCSGGTTNNIYRNKVYDLSSNSTATTIYGMQVTAGTTNNIYNNLIGDLRSPFTNSTSDLMRGMNISATTANASENISFNTVWLNATSAGVNFSSTAISHAGSATATTANLTLRNNIFINNSTPSGTGLTVAYRRTTTSLSNYNAASDRNIFYAGTPGANRLIFYDGTNADQTLAAFKTRVNPREQNSQTENTPFISTVGSSPNFLHISPASGSLAMGNAAPVTGISDDYDLDQRHPTTPDIGADEFKICAGAVGGTATGSTSICGSGTPTITASGYSSGVGSTYQWMSSNSAVNYPAGGTIIAGQTNPATLTTGVVSSTTYYWLRVTCTSGVATDYSNMITVTVNPSAASINASATTICEGQSVTLTENGGTATSWSWSPGGATTQSIIVSPTSTTTYTVTATSPGPCTATADVTIVVNPVPTGVTASSSASPICAGVSVDLSSTVGAPPPPTVLSQNFEGGLGSWTAANTSSGGTTPAAVIFAIQPTGYVYNSETFSGAGGTQFAMANADAGGSGISANTTLTSPTFSLAGYTTASLNFTQYYRHLTAAAGFVEVSTDGGTNWTTAASYGATQGTSTTFAPALVDLTPYVGQSNVMLRFRYTAGWYWYWAIDDIVLTGTPIPYSFSWTSSPAGFTSAVQNPTGVTPNVTTTYTVTVTGIGGCTSSASTTVVVNSPNVTGTVVEPTTCVVNDGSITLSVSGGTGGMGPYSYVWTGTGVNPSSQNQTNLGVGSYSVVVTDIPSGCTRTLVFNLVGPGGCNVCPTIPNVNVSPSPACANQNITLSSTGLTDMGVTYGVTYKYSAVALADPYIGGSTLGTVNNASLTAGNTAASFTGTIPTSGSYFVYAILAPTPLDPGCRPSALFNLTVNSAPTVTCPANITVSNDPNQCGAVVNYPPAIVTGVPAPTVTYSTPSGSFFPRGTTTVTVTATNACGTSTCTFTVTVNDTQPPTITCPANITVNNTPGQCGAIVSYATPTASDNCPGVTVVSAPASGTFFPIGTTTVTSTATDGSGNTATCTFTITVNDNQNPTITCPANVTVNNAAGTCSAVVTYPLPTFSDNCVLAGSTLALSQSTSQAITTGSVACAAGGFHTANSYWRAYNLASLGLPGPLTINSVTFGIELADANGVGTTQPVTVRLHTSAGAFPGGARTLVGTQTFNVPDQTNSLFTGTLTTPVTVPANAILVLEVFTPDGRAPVNNRFYIGSNAAAETGPSYISAPDCAIPNPVTLASIGFPNMHIVLNANGIVGGPSPLTQIAGLPSGGTFPVGVTTNTYRVTDAAGNSSTCSFTVTVVDNQAPVITCPGNITVTSPVGSCTAVVNYTVTATDNCSIASLVRTAGLASGSAFPLGVNTVSWTATDASGNTSSCTFTVTVLDGQLPVISSQPANITACSGSNATFSVTTSNAVTYQWQTFSGGTWNNITGATSSSYTVSNVNIGMNTNTFRVIINGACTSVTSNTATLFVNTLPIITLSSSIPPFLLPGQSLDITATGIPPGGSFVWLKNGVVIAGATGNVLANLTVNDQGSYTVRYTDLNGCVTTSAALVVGGLASDNMWVYPNPNFGQFQVRFYNQNAETATVNVYDSKGAKVYQRSVATTLPYTMISIDLGRAIPNGVYIVELVDGSGKRVGAKQVVVRPN